MIRKKLADLAAEGAALAQKAADKPDEFTDADATRADEIVAEHTRLKGLLDRQTKVSQALAAVQAPDTDTEPDGAPVGKTIGARFVNSDAYQAFKSAHPHGLAKGTPVSFKAIIGKSEPPVDGGPAPLSTDLLDPKRPDFTDDLVYRRPRRFLDLITRGTTAQSYLQYRQVISKTNNASIVGEAKTTDGDTTEDGLKPLSTLATQPAEAKVADYADGMEVTNQELADDGAIAALIDSTLTENLEFEIERVLLHGSGSGIEPVGLFHLTGVLQQDFATDAPTTIRKAITALRETSGANITGILLNPEDDEEWDLMQDSTGRYLGAGPFGTAPATAWALPRIPTAAIEKGTFVAGDLKTIHFLIREALAIEAFNQHKDYAQRNLQYIRAELRAMQLFRAPAKLLIGDLTGN